MARAPLPAFTPIEKEVFFLKATIDIIQDMVNHKMIEVRTHPGGSTVYFPSSVHSAYFNILLLDLLSKSHRFGTEDNYIAELDALCNAPNFNVNNSIAALRDVLAAFLVWLDGEILMDNVPFGALELTQNIRIRRNSLIKISGNILKHNFTRLDHDAQLLAGIMRAQGVCLDDLDAQFAIVDLYEYFHTDIFIYHGSTIAEFLNNIWWGIHRYLTPEFSRSFRRADDGSIRYWYDIPPAITNKYARDTYWELMNYIRSRPYIPVFEVDPILKRRY